MLTEEQLVEIKEYNDGGMYEEEFLATPVIDCLVNDIRTLQQQNKQLVEALDRLISIVDPHHPITAADYRIWLQSVQGE